MKGVAVVTANELRQRLQIKNKLKCRQADETSLAEEMNIPMAEVYEVATFYTTLKCARTASLRRPDGAGVRPAGLPAGRDELLARWPALLETQQVRGMAAPPCIGCFQRPRRPCSLSRGFCGA